MKHGLFSENMKLADLILANYRLLYVLPHFGLGLGFGERTVGQVCGGKGISTSLFLLVCNACTFDRYVPDADTLARIPPDGLMEYLRNFNRDYTENRIPEMIGRILGLVAGGNTEHGEELAGHCKRYRQGAVAHFRYREQEVFPCIAAAMHGKRPHGYTLEEYARIRHLLNSTLDDLRTCLAKQMTCEAFPAVFTELALFSADADRQARLEEKILTALAGA
jgi:regulator of cell morphogenesis and NO signaling